MVGLHTRRSNENFLRYTDLGIDGVPSAGIYATEDGVMASDPSDERIGEDYGHEIIH
jgi:hypothetical protein